MLCYKILTANENADGSGSLSGSERRVRRTRVLALIGRYHRLKNERAVFVDFGVLDRLEVEHTAFLGPDDNSSRWIRLHWTVDATHQAVRQV